MRMKEHYWPFEQERRPSRVIKALKAATRAYIREAERLERAQKVRDLPDPFSKK